MLVNIARYLSLDPESALRKTNRKFRRRFEYLEGRLREQGRKPDDASLAEMESLWQESKQHEKVMSIDALELRRCTTLEEFQRLRRAAARGVGLQRSGTGAAACFLRGFQDRRAGDRRLGWRHHGGLCAVAAGHAPALSLSALPHAGSEGELSQHRAWGAASSCFSARMPLRSATT